mmetsp:Transcript_89498/g.261579  ORF Transcript_89498/g.261579 Transcript_89498/m.261579 type:complete len:90 (-) Transcript_89498:1535-1804(-)
MKGLSNLRQLNVSIKRSGLGTLGFKARALCTQEKGVKRDTDKHFDNKHKGKSALKTVKDKCPPGFRKPMKHEDQDIQHQRAEMGRGHLV